MMGTCGSCFDRPSVFLPKLCGDESCSFARLFLSSEGGELEAHPKMGAWSYFIFRLPARRRETKLEMKMSAIAFIAVLLFLYSPTSSAMGYLHDCWGAEAVSPGAPPFPLPRQIV